MVESARISAKSTPLEKKFCFSDLKCESEIFPKPGPAELFNPSYGPHIFVKSITAGTHRVRRSVPHMAIFWLKVAGRFNALICPKCRGKAVLYLTFEKIYVIITKKPFFTDRVSGQRHLKILGSLPTSFAFARLSYN